MTMDGISRRTMVTALSLLPLALLEGTSAKGESENNDFVTLPCDGPDCRGVEIRDFRVGAGRVVEPGSTIVIKWTGRLADRYGWPFQREEDNEVSFDLGRDRLIAGFVQGVMGMHEGGKRRLLIPSALGYQDELCGPLPIAYGDRRRLFGTVLNKRRFIRAGDLVIDVQLKKVRPPKS